MMKMFEAAASETFKQVDGRLSFEFGSIPDRMDFELCLEPIIGGGFLIALYSLPDLVLVVNEKIPVRPMYRGAS